MGGSALSFETKRLKATEFVNLRDEINNTLKSSGFESYPLKSFHCKESFGDLDILVKTDNNFHNKLKQYSNKGDIKDYIYKKFEPLEIHHNSDVYSFDYKDFQIDLKLIKSSNWETSKYYLDYNDLGNLMGRIAVKLNLKYGHYGLKFVYYPDSNEKYEIILSKEPKKFFEVLGFDYNRYMKGFDYLTDIFDFVIDSKYFNPHYYYFRNLDMKHKKRDSKRKNYMEFLNHIDKNVDAEKYEYKKFDLNDTLNFIDENFPEKDIWTFKKNCDAKAEKKKVIKEKFNGHLIMEKYPELKNRGRELGALISNFRKYIQENKNLELENWIYENDEKLIWETFYNFYLSNK